MPVDRIDEGDAFTAASLNTSFASIEAAVNDLTRANLRRKSLREVHFTEGVITTKATGNTVTPSIGATHTYVNEYPGYDTDTFADPPTGVVATNEWNVILGNATKCRKTFTALTLGMDTGAGESGVAGLLVFGNVEAEWYWSDGATGDGTFDEAFAIVTAVMYLASDANWYIIPRTERFLTQPTIAGADTGSPGFGEYVRHFRDMPRRHLITAADITEGTGTIAGLQIVTAVSVAHSAKAFAASSLLELWQFSLTVIPLHAKEAP